ncbi:hypothetical protein I7I51_04497 [Histoplasma capsulatum]|uniref:Uncharacterized protein n=1 Tax=Ajellomyces capsulatus TaxID=5037 RepID=A0A8A1M8K9_AJECA|nr:hypothetical protein I7I51_04497 [Histoplasma capsulatum]
MSNNSTSSGTHAAANIRHLNLQHDSTSTRHTLAGYELDELDPPRTPKSVKLYRWLLSAIVVPEHACYTYILWPTVMWLPLIDARENGEREAMVMETPLSHQRNKATMATS